MTLLFLPVLKWPSDMIMSHLFYESFQIWDGSLLGEVNLWQLTKWQHMCNYSTYLEAAETVLSEKVNKFGLICSQRFWLHVYHQMWHVNNTIKSKVNGQIFGVLLDTDKQIWYLNIFWRKHDIEVLWVLNKYMSYTYNTVRVFVFFFNFNAKHKHGLVGACKVTD